jgi:hypothetical protein
VLINSVKQLDSAVAVTRLQRQDNSDLQQQTNELKQQVEELKQQVNNCCTASSSTLSSPDRANSINNSAISWLAQNKPNPFNSQTVIEYNVVEEGTASIMIFDMNGKLLKTIPVKIPGKGSVLVNANDLVAGMYYYSLLVNGKEIDTKKMILTE